MNVPASARRETWRWSAAFAFAVLAHGSVAMAVLTNWQTADVAAGMPVVIELDLMSASPDAASSNSVPGPEQTVANLTTEPEKTEEVEETEEVKETEPEETEPETEQATVEPPTPDPVEVPEVVPAKPAPTPLPRPEVKKPDSKPKPKREAKKPERKPKPQAPSATATTAPSAADTVASVAASRAFGQGASNALPNWNSRIVAHLQRHKRYPAEAQARGETGVARLNFTVNRSGHVISSRLTGSSGYSTLDRETAELILRAQPLPPPPPELAGARFSFSVPIRYSMR